MACTNSSGPWKKIFTIRLQPVALDWIRDEDPQLLFPGGKENFEVSPVVSEDFKLDGPVVGTVFESFKLEVLVGLEKYQKLRMNHSNENCRIKLHALRIFYILLNISRSFPQF
jgi:hypothetical protein